MRLTALLVAAGSLWQVSAFSQPALSGKATWRWSIRVHWNDTSKISSSAECPPSGIRRISTDLARFLLMTRSGICFPIY
jgi:hypothetical protein